MAFVSASGTGFILDGAPFPVAGANNYYLSYSPDVMRDAVFDAAARFNCNVIRTWGFLDDAGHGVSFQRWDAGAQTIVINDGADGLQRLDHVLDAGWARGFRFILPLVNYWPDFGGMDQYAGWLGLGDREQFYTEARARDAYRNWVGHMAARYREHPAILAWELANEPRSGDENVLLDWAGEMSAFLKQADPNHLIGVGDEGFVNGLLDLPFIDFGTNHLYPENAGHAPAWGLQWIGQHLDAAERAAKPMLLEEFGLRPGPERDAWYGRWLARIEQRNGAGALFWMLASTDDQGQRYRYGDEYTIFEPEDAPSIADEFALLRGLR